MRGKILSYDQGKKVGNISGEDGNRYNFNIADFQNSQSPITGKEVDFLIDGENAQKIYVLVPPHSPKRVTAALFALFLGGLGIHKFYLGYKKAGVIMLLGSIFGAILLFIPNIIISFIALVEFFLYISKSDQAFEKIYILNKRSWF